MGISKVNVEMREYICGSKAQEGWRMGITPGILHHAFQRDFEGREGTN